MSINSEQDEITGIVNRVLDNLVMSVVSAGDAGSDLRQQIGKVRSRFMAMLYAGTFPAELLKCFTTALLANVDLKSLSHVHNGLFEEDPGGPVADAVVQMSIVFCLSTESRMIATLEFDSRDDVEIMIKKMKIAFDMAKDLTADAVSSDSYRALTSLAGALTNHLANVSRPLPRMVTFLMPKTMPALLLSQRLYYTGERWEEVAAENKTIHPAFSQRRIRGLSK